MLEKLNIMLLSEDATIPTRSHSTDAGLDLYAAEDITIIDKAIVRTDVAVDVPAGYEAQIRPRSGLTSKTNLRVQLGTVDAGYHGPLGVMIDNRIEIYEDDAVEMLRDTFFEQWMWDHNKYSLQANPQPIHIKKGDKIAQLVVVPIVTPSVNVVDSFDSNSDRGENGFGSTGQ